MSRKQANRAILLELYNLIEKYPDLRFGQILVNCDIIQLVPDYNNTALVALDPFNEESEIVWNRMKDNKFAFKELFN